MPVRTTILALATMLTLTAAAWVTAPLAAQAPAIAVFLDCQTHGCDTEHLRTEIGFVNWVRDRTVAGVHVLITSQTTGGGGVSYALSFLGMRSFAADTLQLGLASSQTSSSSERRDALTNRIAQGLLRYAIHTTAAERVSVRVPTGGGDDDDAGRTLDDGATDPWKQWVFSAGIDLGANGESRQANQRVAAEFSANRVTEAWKFELDVEGSYRTNRYDLDDGRLRIIRRDYNSDLQLTKALAARWSAGAEVRAGTSTFRNLDLYLRFAPVLEYSFYPYSEFSRRQMTLQYSVGVNHFDYTEETLFDKLKEQVTDERLELSMRYQQPWGSAGLSVSGSHYFHDLSRYALGADSFLSVRLFKGLEAEMGVEYSRVHNQLYIQKGDASDEDVLTERLALATGYEYELGFGVRYTFGSIFNNIVNRRLD